ncbi:MAG: ATP synthase F1 subunit gamma [Vicinamibacterales bacterium]
MPSLIDIRRRVRAVKSTQQITKAMKMVAASKLRRAQERMQAARPYANKMLQVLNSLAHRVDPNAHPLLAPAKGGIDRKTLLIVVTADKGLCGSFNTNILKGASGFILDQPQRTVSLSLVGRKGRDYFRPRGFGIHYEIINLFAKLSYSDAQDIARSAIDAFTAGTFDDVYLAYNEFKTVLTQKLVIEQLLPIPRFSEAPDAKTAGAWAASASVDYLYEPSAATLFAELLPRHVEVQVYRALLESSAAEHAARMTAMDTATRNSSDMIDSLTLYMNKVRQANITREIIEVVSGAAAL